MKLSAELPGSHFETTDMVHMQCALCGRTYKIPRMGSGSGRGNQGYGRKGSQRGATRSIMARHLRKEHPEVPMPAPRVDWI